MDKFFKISERGSNVKTEIIAGLTTFFAMAYIVITNPNQIVGFNHFGPMGEFQTIWNAVYIASIIGAVVGTLLMAFYAKMPFAQACGMGLNSFFYVSFIIPFLLFDENGNVIGGEPIKGYQAGLCIILLEGLLFLLLSVSGIRSKLARSLPDCLKKAIPAGIGLFIAFLGFQNVGLIQSNPYTLVQLVDIHGAINSEEGIRAVAPALLTVVGLILIAVLEKLKVKGSIIISILIVSVIYYPVMGVTPSFDLSQVGQTFVDFAQVGVTGVFQAESWQNAFGSQVGGVFSAIMLTITYCLVDMFDTIGTLYGTAAQANMLDKNGDPIDVDKCMTSDAIATTVSAISGTSTVTTFVESAAGVGAGGRTGLTSLVVAICFFICMFLSPIASLIPACATAPALIWVGVLMLKGFAKVDMEDPTSAVPAFLALIMMPLTYSISTGIGVGAIAYVLIRIFTGKYSKDDIIATVIALLFVVKFVFVTM